MIYLPLEFWFAKNTNLALPTVSLPYKEQEIFIHFHDSVDDYDTAYKKYKEKKNKWTNYVFYLIKYHYL